MLKGYHQDGYPGPNDYCKCDDDFLDYIDRRRIDYTTIFHFGTGILHKIGINALAHNNYVLGVTPSIEEYESYINLVTTSKKVNAHYQLWFTDAYCIDERLLPKFDYICLFHLCEYLKYSDPENIIHNDFSFLRMCMSKLNPSGNLVFFRESSAYGETRRLITSELNQGNLIKCDSFKSLDFYKLIRR